MAVRGEIRGVLTGFALVGAMGLLIASADVQFPGLGMLSSLRFHLAALLLVLAGLILVSGAWLRALLLAAFAVFCGALGVLRIMAQQDFRAPYDGVARTSGLTLLSFNTLQSNSRGADIAAFMVASRADVAVIMEAGGLQAGMAIVSAGFPYRVGCTAEIPCDLAIFSRMPIQEAHVYSAGELRRNRLMTARVTVNGQSVTIVAIHLSKPYYDEAAMVELAALSSLIETIGGPIILAGDFNDAAWSDQVNAFVLRSRMTPPPRHPATWPVAFGAFGVPIDNIFTHGPAVIDTIEALPDAFGSNHRGLLATIGFVASAP